MLSFYLDYKARLRRDFARMISSVAYVTKSTDQESILQRLLNMVSLTALNMSVLWLQLVSMSLHSDLFIYIYISLFLGGTIVLSASSSY